MQYNLLGKGLTITPEIREYVDKKLGSLDKFVHNAAAARVDVELSYLESEERTFRAELMLYNHKVMRSEARGRALHEAFDKAMGELYTELSRAKGRRLRHLRHGALKVKEFLRGWRKDV